MKTRVTAKLRAEASAFAFRFACDDCAHFEASREACAHGYPTAPRRDALGGPDVTFCKEFELGAEGASESANESPASSP